MRRVDYERAEPLAESLGLTANLTERLVRLKLFVLFARNPCAMAPKPCDDFQETEPPPSHSYADEKCARCGEMRCDHE